MARFMLDTDISSYVMKRSDREVTGRLSRTRIEDVCISLVTKAELLYGVALSPRREQDQAALEEYLRHVEVMEMGDGVVLHYAAIGAELKRRGLMIGANDLWIAAHARQLGLTLVTNNVREFERVDGLVLENWARAQA